MKEKVLIILGGNSTLIAKFLQTKIDKKYLKIIIISHRKYKGLLKHKIIDFLDPEYLISLFRNILLFIEVVLFIPKSKIINSFLLLINLLIIYLLSSNFESKVDTNSILFILLNI